MLWKSLKKIQTAVKAFPRKIKSSSQKQATSSLISFLPSWIRIHGHVNLDPVRIRMRNAVVRYKLSLFRLSYRLLISVKVSAYQLTGFSECALSTLCLTLILEGDDDDDCLTLILCSMEYDDCLTLILCSMEGDEDDDF
jgi:hypothetical protein